MCVCVCVCVCVIIFVRIYIFIYSVSFINKRTSSKLYYIFSKPNIPGFYHILVKYITIQTDINMYYLLPNFTAPVKK